MSRIGGKAIPVPEKVSVDIKDRNVTVKGPKGELVLVLVDEVTAALNDNEVTVTPIDDSKRARSMWGLQRSLIANMVTGVSDGFEKKLLIQGVGYRAQMKGKTLNLQLGFSHDVNIEAPEGVDVKCDSQTEVTISGIDKQKVGQFAAEVRGWRPPEPYKGKGVRYADEFILRKEGKKK
ncbi:MAG: 50S ribosomal protein L6 [Alphaproteobacteria bacterium]